MYTIKDFLKIMLGTTEFTETKTLMEIPRWSRKKDCF